MKIQLSKNKIVKDHLVLWQEPGDDVDLVCDLKTLTFRPGSVEQICSFHVLDHMFIDEAVAAIKNWRDCLAPGGKLFIIVDDFEYVARGFVGGDITIDLFNKHHSHASQYDRKSLGDLLISSGFPESEIKVWFAEVPGLFAKKHYELVIEAQK